MSLLRFHVHEIVRPVVFYTEEEQKRVAVAISNSNTSAFTFLSWLPSAQRCRLPPEPLLLGAGPLQLLPRGRGLPLALRQPLRALPPTGKGKGAAAKIHT